MTHEVRLTEPAAANASGSDVEAKILVASQWTLMWRKFRKHRLAMVGGTVTLLVYLVVVFAEFLAPFPGVAAGWAGRRGTERSYPQRWVKIRADLAADVVIRYRGSVLARR